MKRKTLLLPVLLFMSCTGNSASEATAQKELEATVLAKHDSAMAQMGDIYKLRRNLRSLHDTLAARQTDTLTLQALQEQMEGLSQADAVMMDWMHQYHAPDSLAPQHAEAYLQQELLKIQRVQFVMDSTLRAARKTFQSYEQPE
ncbi:hypothetical protein MKJ04_06925 [Pontibacter sp. E15-1]|uniref:hypothetical protein n=1 Tax=Pontibacter sp. E15-1 TaxID=2919918 RepID=UPI001F4F7796|nr:hypothetical protein [Pontibacter sp. E15-1]MCJ8164575.1 hypothetical protein [Pontibacter sp. E15-1]